MEYKITPPLQISADVVLPASKSISNRVLLLNALSEGNGIVHNIARCDDTEVMLKALSAGEKAGVPVTVDVHGAGTAMRFLAAYYCLYENVHIMTGSPRMLSRPVNVLVDALRSLGAEIDYAGEECFPPLRIGGGLQRGGTVELPADVSSQYISALLMVAPCLSGGLTLVLAGAIASRPYINMTIALMNTFGAKAAWTGENEITVEEGGYAACEFTVENDWSAASYWYEIMALSDDANARVTLYGLCSDSLQGDARVAEYFGQLGVATRFTDDGVVLEKIPCYAEKVLELDLHDEPDLAQTLVVACVMAGKQFEFSGLANLRIKETDRLAALTAEMRKLGYILRAGGDGSISWRGERCAAEDNPVIATYDDHRMAMSFTPVCLKRGNILIDSPEVVAKSYPLYWKNLVAAGFGVEKF